MQRITLTGRHRNASRSEMARLGMHVEAAPQRFRLVSPDRETRDIIDAIETIPWHAIASFQAEGPRRSA